MHKEILYVTLLGILADTYVWLLKILIIQIFLRRGYLISSHCCHPYQHRILCQSHFLSQIIHCCHLTNFIHTFSKIHKGLYRLNNKAPIKAKCNHIYARIETLKVPDNNNYILTAKSYFSILSLPIYSLAFAIWTEEGSTISTLAYLSSNTCFVTLPIPAPQSNALPNFNFSAKLSINPRDVSLSHSCTMP